MIFLDHGITEVCCFLILLIVGCCLFLTTRSDSPTTHREQGDYGVVAGSQVNQVDAGRGSWMESVVDCFGRVLNV